MQRTGFGCNHRRCRTEITDKSLQRLFADRRLRNDERVVVPGNRDNRRGIVAIRFVELIVIILRFSEVINHVAEMIKKGRPVGRTRGVQVAGDLIRHFDLVRVSMDAGSPRVADHLKDYLLRGLNSLCDLSSVRSPCGLEAVKIAGIATRRAETHRIFGEKALNLLVELRVRRLRYFELSGIRSWNTFVENRLAENGLRQRSIRFSWHTMRPFLSP